MEDQKALAKEAATNAAKEEGQKAVEKAVKGTEAEKVVKDILGGGKTDTTKAAADTTKAPTDDVQKKVEDEAKKKIQNLLKKKKTDSNP